jgi:hypothetical protein
VVRLTPKAFINADLGALLPPSACHLSGYTAPGSLGHRAPSVFCHRAPPVFTQRAPGA